MPKHMDAFIMSGFDGSKTVATEGQRWQVAKKGVRQSLQVCRLAGVEGSRCLGRRAATGVSKAGWQVHLL